jgi:hypothetical protein
VSEKKELAPKLPYIVTHCAYLLSLSLSTFSLSLSLLSLSQLKLPSFFFVVVAIVWGGKAGTQGLNNNNKTNFSVHIFLSISSITMG